MSSNGFALLTSHFGIIHQVIRDDLGLEGLAAGQSLTNLVEASERVKLLNFLVDLRVQRAVFHWEINLPTQAEIITLHLSGFEVKDQLMIIGARTHHHTLKLLDDLLAINNEQASALRLLMADPGQVVSRRDETDFSMFDELTRMNNEMAALHRELAKKNVELERLYEEVRTLAITDSLTGVYNRRGLYEKGQQEFERARRYQRPLAAILFDVDRFKTINDQYGHQAGDTVLVEVTRRVQRQLRKADIFGRYGGDEFIILLPETSLSAALRTSERLRALADEQIQAQGHSLKITLSLGVVQFSEEFADLDTLLLHADQALYRAKGLGGNTSAAEMDG